MLRELRRFALCGLLSGLVGCTVPAEGDADGPTGSSSSALVTYGRGFAWITSSGAVGTSWSSMGTVAGTRLGVGSYEIGFDGMPYVLGRVTAQVVAYGGNKYCKLHSYPVGYSARTTVRVLCFNAYGTPTDSSFTLWVDQRQGPDADSRGGYAYVSGSTTSSWYSSAGNTSASQPTAVWDASAQESRVTFPGLDFQNAGVHVTAVGNNPRRCKVIDWHLGAVRVKCFDAAGTPVSAPYLISYQDGAAFPGHAGGHTRAVNNNIVGYASREIPYRSCDYGLFVAYPHGNQIRVDLPNADVAPGGSWRNILPTVTGVGETPEYCNVAGWSLSSTTGTANVWVQCYDLAGLPVVTSANEVTVSITNRALQQGC
jgi:hypothetical protein